MATDAKVESFPQIAAAEKAEKVASVAVPEAAAPPVKEEGEEGEKAKYGNGGGSAPAPEAQAGMKDKEKEDEKEKEAGGGGGSKAMENGVAAVAKDRLGSEAEAVQAPLHWHAKPCLHVSSIGGPLAEEELRSLFSPYGTISSITFETERRDGAIVRYERTSGDSEELVLKARGALNSTKLGERTIIVEHVRPDSLLFVGNLTPDIDDAMLLKMFEPHGRLERAFVMRNAEAKSKCYGFVEYSLKSEAAKAKQAMENINMDGRVLRVEWSDCRKVADMFSTILFIDRIAKNVHNIDVSLRNLFSQHGEVRDCHLAIGINQLFRGFGFIDFYHSMAADRAHQALDGYNLEGSAIRVSFANPSKSAQSYKLRYGADAAQTALGGVIGRGALGDRSLRPVAVGMIRNAALRTPMALPLPGARFMGTARPRMFGRGGIGMQFGRGGLGGGVGSPGMVGRGHVMAGNMAPRAGVAIGGNLLQMGGARLPMGGQGAITITSSVIAQVATAQAKAREEEAKARAEARKQNFTKVVVDQHSSDQHQKFPQNNQLHNQHAQQGASIQGQYPVWNQQTAAQTQQSYPSQYYTQPAQVPMQQQQVAQNPNVGYYQQQSHHVQASTPLQQYGQASQSQAQYGQQVAQNYGQAYGQTTQTSAQPYVNQHIQQMPQNYAQGFGQAVQGSAQEYTQQYTQQVPQNQGQMYALPGQTAEQQHQQVAQQAGVSAVPDSSQQAYAAYYQEQAANIATQSGTAPAASPATQQNYDAQWAAYYAAQAAYQQQQASLGQQQGYGVNPEQSSATDVGTKRTVEQMDSGSQAAQGVYNYAQMAAAASVYSQQQQQQQQVGAAYQAESAAAAGVYQQQGYQQQPAQEYQQQAPTASYEQPVTASASQTPAAVAAPHDYNKRQRY